MKLVAGVLVLFTSDGQTWCYGRNTLRLVLNLPEIDSGIYSEFGSQILIGSGARITLYFRIRKIFGSWIKLNKNIDVNHLMQRDVFFSFFFKNQFEWAQISPNESGWVRIGPDESGWVRMGLGQSERIR